MKLFLLLLILLSLSLSAHAFEEKKYHEYEGYECLECGHKKEVRKR